MRWFCTSDRIHSTISKLTNLFFIVLIVLVPLCLVGLPGISVVYQLSLSLVMEGPFSSLLLKIIVLVNSGSTNLSWRPLFTHPFTFFSFFFCFLKLGKCLELCSMLLPNPTKLNFVFGKRDFGMQCFWGREIIIATSDRSVMEEKYLRN